MAERGKNQGKFYLKEFAPFLTAGSTGESALVVYNRKTLGRLQATIQARLPLDRQISMYHQSKMAATHLAGTRLRVAILAVPGGNLDALLRFAPSFARLAMKQKIISVFDPIDRIVEVLNEFQPDRIISYSFFLAILAQEQLGGRLQIEFNHPMSFLAGTGEPLTEHTQKLALKAWNKPIQDCYGAAECWFMATSCRNSDRLHVMSDLYILEIVDRNGRPVPDGQLGEKILVTNLYNFVQPLIRYEVEDIIGYADQNCKCGLPFPALRTVRGRASDVFYFKKPKGGYETFHPYGLIVPLHYMFEVRQYQIVQTARNELTFFYVPQSPELDNEHKLKQTLEGSLKREGIESHITLTLKRAESIARDERSGKYKLVISRGAPADLDR